MRAWMRNGCLSDPSKRVDTESTSSTVTMCHRQRSLRKYVARNQQYVRLIDHQLCDLHRCPLAWQTTSNYGEGYQVVRRCRSIANRSSPFTIEKRVLFHAIPDSALINFSDIREESVAFLRQIVAWNLTSRSRRFSPEFFVGRQFTFILFDIGHGFGVGRRQIWFNTSLSDHGYLRLHNSCMSIVCRTR